jgi:AcrR family transcriptional regulator
VRRERHGDRRVVKTERALRDALVSLVHEKHYESIAVREILERADVGRSAFYAHFRDKRDLLESGIQHMLRAAPPRRRSALPERFDKALWFSGAVFDYVGQHRHAHDDKIGRRGRAALHEHLKRSLIEEIENDVRACVHAAGGSQSRIPPRLLAEYIVTTFILILNWWVESRSTLTARDVDALFLSMVVPGLQAATGSCWHHEAMPRMPNP